MQSTSLHLRLLTCNEDDTTIDLMTVKILCAAEPFACIMDAMANKEY